MKTKLAIALAAVLSVAVAGPVLGQGQIRNWSLALSVRPRDGAYQVAAPAIKGAVLVSEVAAEVNGRWLVSSKFPKRHTVKSSFTDAVGPGQALTTTFSGLANAPDLVCVLHLYSGQPYGVVTVKVLNNTSTPIKVQEIRVVDAVGEQRINLGASDSDDRVMADTFSEDPPIHIAGLAGAPNGEFIGVRSLLVYNMASKQSLLLAALTSKRFLTVSHLHVADANSGSPRVSSLIVDSTGTTQQIMRTREHLRPDQQVQLSLPVAPGQSLSSESVLIAAGPHYMSQLEDYGEAVRLLHHARVDGPAPMGWWSWTAFYAGINQGEALTNAQWLSAHLKHLGYNYFHIDEGYDYARGEYTTSNAIQFPDMWKLEFKVHGLGLTPAIWTAPFEASARSWVYEHHKDWLVRDAHGQPIQIGYVHGHVDPLYALDTTNPGAQAYLRKTYCILTRQWGIRYIKLDFMDSAAVEGFRYRPNTTALEAQRIGLKVIREAVGNDVLLDKDGSPMLNPVGLVDEGRISVDTAHSFKASFNAAPNIAARFYMNRNFYRADPDAFNLTEAPQRPQSGGKAKAGLSLSDAQVQIVLAAIAGGMYEIGDDLPTLGSEPKRLALVENQELINMNRLGRAAVPLDLMTFPAADLQPSVFFLPEDRRQAMLAVFNWSEQPRSHNITLAGLLPANHPYRAYDVLNHDAPVTLENGALHLDNQPAHSVRLIKLVDTSIAPAAPDVLVDTPATARTGNEVTFSGKTGRRSEQALTWRWSFGDGTAEAGRAVTHTYTKPGTYTVKLEASGVDSIAAHKTFTVKVTGLPNTEFDLMHNRRAKGQDCCQ